MKYGHVWQGSEGSAVCSDWERTPPVLRGQRFAPREVFSNVHESLGERLQTAEQAFGSLSLALLESGSSHRCPTCEFNHTVLVKQSKTGFADTADELCGLNVSERFLTPRTWTECGSRQKTSPLFSPIHGRSSLWECPSLWFRVLRWWLLFTCGRFGQRGTSSSFHVTCALNFTRVSQSQTQSHCVKGGQRHRDTWRPEEKRDDPRRTTPGQRH